MSFLQKIMGKNSKKDKSKGRKMAPEKGLKGAAALATSSAAPLHPSPIPKKPEAQARVAAIAAPTTAPMPSLPPTTLSQVAAAQPSPPPPKKPEGQASVAAAVAALTAPPPKLKGKKSRAQPSASTPSQVNDNLGSQSPKEQNQVLPSSLVQDSLTAKHKVEYQQPVFSNPPTSTAGEKNSLLNKCEVTPPIQPSTLETSSSNTEEEKGVKSPTDFSEKSQEVPIVTKGKSGRVSKGTQLSKISQQSKEEKPKDVQVANKPKALLTTESRELPKQSTNVTQTVAGIRLDTEYVEVAHVTRSTHASSWLHDKLVLETQVVATSLEAALTGPSPRETSKTKAGGSHAQASETPENKNSRSLGPAIVQKIEGSEALDQSKQSTSGCANTSKRISDALWTELETFEQQINQDKTSQTSISKQKENVDEDHKTKREQIENVHGALATTTSIQLTPGIDEVQPINTEKLQDKDERPEEFEQTDFTAKLNNESSTAVACEAKNENLESEQKTVSNDIGEITSEKPSPLEKELESATPAEATADTTKTENLMSQQDMSKIPHELERVVENVIVTEATLSAISPKDIIHKQSSARAKDDLQEIPFTDDCPDDKVQELDTTKSLKVCLQESGKVNTTLSPDKGKPEAQYTVAEAPTITKEQQNPLDVESAYRKELEVTDEAISRQGFCEVLNLQQVQKQVLPLGLKQEDIESDKKPLTQDSGESTWPDRYVQDVADKLAETTVNFGVIGQMYGLEEIEEDSKQNVDAQVEISTSAVDASINATDLEDQKYPRIETCQGSASTETPEQAIMDMGMQKVEVASLPLQTPQMDEMQGLEVAHVSQDKDREALHAERDTTLDSNDKPTTAVDEFNHSVIDLDRSGYDEIDPANGFQPGADPLDKDFQLKKPDVIASDADSKVSAEVAITEQQHIAEDELQKQEVTGVSLDKKEEDRGDESEQDHKDSMVQEPVIIDGTIQIENDQELKVANTTQHSEDAGQETKATRLSTQEGDPQMTDAAIDKETTSDRIEIAQDLEYVNIREEASFKTDEQREALCEPGVVNEYNSEEQELQMTDATVEESASDNMPASRETDIRENVSSEIDEQREAIVEPGVTEEEVKENLSDEQKLQMTDTAIQKESTSDRIEIKQVPKEENSFRMDKESKEPGVVEAQTGDVSEYEIKEQVLQRTDTAAESEPTNNRTEITKASKDITITEEAPYELDKHPEDPEMAEIKIGGVNGYNFKEEATAGQEPTNDVMEIIQAFQDIDSVSSTIDEQREAIVEPREEALWEPESSEVQIGGVNKCEERELQMTDAATEKEPASNVIEIMHDSEGNDIREEVSTNIDEKREAMIKPGEDTNIKEEGPLEINEQMEVICKPETVEVQIGGMNESKEQELKTTEVVAEKEGNIIDISKEVSSNIDEQKEVTVEYREASRDISIEEKASFEINELREGICNPEINEVQAEGLNRNDPIDSELQVTDTEAEKDSTSDRTEMQVSQHIDNREELSSCIDEPNVAIVEPRFAEISIREINENKYDDQEPQMTNAAVEIEPTSESIKIKQAPKNTDISEDESFRVEEENEAICEPGVAEVESGDGQKYQPKEQVLQRTDTPVAKAPANDKTQIIQAPQDIAEVQLGGVIECMSKPDTAAEKEPTSYMIEITQASKDTGIREDVSAMCEPGIAQVPLRDETEYKSEEQVLQTTDAAAEKAKKSDRIEISQALEDPDIKEEESLKADVQRETVCELQTTDAAAEKESSIEKVSSNIGEQREATVEHGEASRDVSIKGKESVKIDEQREGICKPEINGVQMGSAKGGDSKESELQVMDTAAEKESTSDRTEMQVSQHIDAAEKLSSIIDEHKVAIVGPGVAEISIREANENKYDEQQLQVKKEPTIIEIKQAPKQTDISKDESFIIEEEKEAMCEPKVAEVQTGDANEYKPKEQVQQWIDAAIDKVQTNNQTKTSQALEDITLREEASFEIDEKREAICKPEIAEVRIEGVIECKSKPDAAAEKEPIRNSIEIAQASKDTNIREEVSVVCEPVIAQVQLRDATMYKSEEQVLETTNAAVEEEVTSDRIEILQVPEDIDIKEEALLKANEHRETVCVSDIAVAVEIDGSQMPDYQLECQQNTSAVNNQNKQEVWMDKLHEKDAQDEPDTKIAVDDQETNVCELKVPSKQESDIPTKTDTLEEDDHSHPDKGHLQHIDDQPKSEQKQEWRDLNASQFIGSDIEKQATDNIDEKNNDVQQEQGTKSHLEDQVQSFDILDKSDENMQKIKVHEQETEKEKPTSELKQIENSTIPLQSSLLQDEECQIGELNDDAAEVKMVTERSLSITEISSSFGEITGETKKHVPADSVEVQPSPNVEVYNNEVKEIDVIPEADEQRSLCNATNSVPILSTPADEKQASIEAVDQDKSAKEVEMTILCDKQGNDECISIEQRTKELQFAQILTLPTEASSALDAHDNELQIAEEANEQVKNPEVNNICQEQESSDVCDESMKLEDVEQFDKQADTDETFDADNENSDVWNPEVPDVSYHSEQWSKNLQDNQSTTPPTEKERASGVVEIQDNELDEVQPTNAQVMNSQSNSGDEQKTNEVAEMEEKPSVQQLECKQSTGAVKEELSRMKKENEETQAGAQHNDSLKAGQYECEALAVELEENSANRECDDASLKMSVMSEETVSIKAENAAIDIKEYEKCTEETETEEKQSFQQPKCEQSTGAISEELSGKEKENEEMQAGAQHTGSLQASQGEALAKEVEGYSVDKACVNPSGDDTSLHTSEESTEETVCVKDDNAVLVDVKECQKSTEETICVEQCQDESKETNPTDSIVENKEPNQEIENQSRIAGQETGGGELIRHEVDEQQDAIEDLELDKNRTETEEQPSVQQPENKESKSDMNEDSSSMEKENEDTQAGAQNRSVKTGQDEAESEDMAMELEEDSANKECYIISEDGMPLRRCETSAEETACVEGEDALINVKPSQDEAEGGALATELDRDSANRTCDILSEDDVALKTSEKSTEETTEDATINVEEQTETEEKQSVQQLKCEQSTSAINEESSGMEKENKEMQAGAQRNGSLKAGQDEVVCEALAIEPKGNTADEVCDIPVEHNMSFKTSEESTEETVCVKAQDAIINVKKCQESAEETVCVKAEDVVADAEQLQDEAKETNPTHDIIENKPEEKLQWNDQEEDQKEETQKFRELTFEQEQRIDAPIADSVNPLRMDDQEVDSGKLIRHDIDEHQDSIDVLESNKNQTEALCNQNFPAAEVFHGLDATSAKADDDGLTEAAVVAEVHGCDQPAQETSHGFCEILNETHDRVLPEAPSCTQEAHTSQDVEIINLASSGTERVPVGSFLEEHGDQRLEATSKSVDAEMEKDAQQEHQIDTDLLRSQQQVQEYMEIIADGQETGVHQLGVNPDQADSTTVFSPLEDEATFDVCTDESERSPEEASDKDEDVTQELNKKKEGTEQREESNELASDEVFTEPRVGKQVTTLNEATDGMLEREIAGALLEVGKEGLEDATQEPNDEAEQNQIGYEVPSNEVFSEPKVEEQIRDLKKEMDSTHKHEIARTPLEVDKDFFKHAMQEPSGEEEATKQNQEGYEVPFDEVFTELKVADKETDGTEERELTGAPIEADNDDFTDATQGPSDRKETTYKNQEWDEVASDEVFTEAKIEKQVNKKGTREVEVRGASLEEEDKFEDATNDKQEATKQNQGGDEVTSEQVTTLNEKREGMKESVIIGAPLEANIEECKDNTKELNDKDEATGQNPEDDEMLFYKECTKCEVEEQASNLNKESNGIEMPTAPFEEDKDRIKDATQEPNNKKEACEQSQESYEEPSNEVTQGKEQDTTLNEEEDHAQECGVQGALLEADKEGFKDDMDEATEQNQGEGVQSETHGLLTEPKVEERGTTLNDKKDCTQECEVTGVPFEADKYNAIQEPNDTEETEKNGEVKVSCDEVTTECKIEEEVTTLNEETDGTHESEITRAAIEADNDKYTDATQVPNDKEEAAEQNQERDEVLSNEIFTEPKCEGQDTTLIEERDDSKETEIADKELTVNKQEEKVQHLNVNLDQAETITGKETTIAELTNQAERGVVVIKAIVPPAEEHQTYNKDEFKNVVQEANHKEEATELNQDKGEVPSDDSFTEPKVKIAGETEIASDHVPTRDTYISRKLAGDNNLESKEEALQSVNDAVEVKEEDPIAPKHEEQTLVDVNESIELIDKFKDVAQEANHKEEATELNQGKAEVPSDESFTDPEVKIAGETEIAEDHIRTRDTFISEKIAEDTNLESKEEVLQSVNDAVEVKEDDHEEEHPMALKHEEQTLIDVNESIEVIDGFKDVAQDANHKEETTKINLEKGEVPSNDSFTEPIVKIAGETEAAGDHVNTRNTYISRKLAEDDYLESKDKALQAVNDAVEVREIDHEEEDPIAPKHEKQTLVDVNDSIEGIDVPIAAEGRAALESVPKAYPSANENESDHLASTEEDCLPKHTEECESSTLEEHSARQEENFSLHSLSADSSSANLIEAQTAVAEKTVGAASTDRQLESDIEAPEAKAVALQTETKCQKEKCDQDRIGHMHEEDTSNVMGMPQNDKEELEVVNQFLNVDNTHIDAKEAANIAFEKTNETELVTTKSYEEGTERDDAEIFDGQDEKSNSTGVDIQKDDIEKRNGMEELDTTSSIGVDKDSQDTENQEDVEELEGPMKKLQVETRGTTEDLEGPEKTLQVETSNGSEELGAEETLKLEATNSVEVDKERYETEGQDVRENVEETENTCQLEVTGSIEVVTERDDTEKKDDTEKFEGGEQALTITSIEVERERNETEGLGATVSREVDADRDATKKGDINEKLTEAEETLEVETTKSLEEGIETENTEGGDDIKELKGQENTLQLESNNPIEMNIKRDNTERWDGTEKSRGAEEPLKFDSMRVAIERDGIEEPKGKDEETDRKEQNKNFEQSSAILGDREEHSTHADEENNDLKQIDVVSIPLDALSTALELEVTDASLDCIGQSDELKDLDRKDVRQMKTDLDLESEQNPVNKQVTSSETNNQLEIEVTDTPLDDDKQLKEFENLKGQSVEPDQISPVLKCEQTHAMPGDAEMSSTNVGSETENEQQQEGTNQSPDTAYGMPELQVRDSSVKASENKYAEQQLYETDEGAHAEEKETSLETVVEAVAPSTEGDNQKDDLQEVEKAAMYGHQIVQVDDLSDMMIEQSQVLINSQIKTPKSQEALPTTEEDQIAAEKEQQLWLTELSKESHDIDSERNSITIKSQNKAEGSDPEHIAGELQDLELRDVPLTFDQRKMDMESEQAFRQCDLACEQPITQLKSEEAPAPSSQEKEHSIDIQEKSQELKAEGIATVQSDETSTAPIELQKQESHLVDEGQGPENINSTELFTKVPFPLGNTEGILNIRQYKNEAEEQHNTIHSIIHQQESTVQDEGKDDMPLTLTTNEDYDCRVSLMDEDVQNQQAQEPSVETSSRETHLAQELACPEITPLHIHEEQPCSDAEEPEVKDLEVKAAEHQMLSIKQEEDRVTCKNIDQAPDVSEIYELTAQNFDKDSEETREIYVSKSNMLLKELAPTEDDNVQHTRVVQEVLGEPNQKVLDAMNDNESQKGTKIHALIAEEDEPQQSYAKGSKNENDTRIASILLSVEQQESPVVTGAESKTDMGVASILLTVDKQESTAVTEEESVIDTKVASLLLTVQQKSTAGIDTTVASVLLTVQQQELTAVTEPESKIKNLKEAVAAIEGLKEEASKLEKPTMTTLEAFMVENEASRVVKQEEHMQNSKAPDAGQGEQNVDDIAKEPPPSINRDEHKEQQSDCVPASCLYQKQPTNEGNVLEPDAAGGNIAAIESTIEQENSEEADGKLHANVQHRLAVARQLKST